MEQDFSRALELVNKHLADIRRRVDKRDFDPNKVAEIEVNDFYYQGETVPRMMVVLRATGCQHYSEHQGCSMCGHFEGTTSQPVKTENYLNQWRSVLGGVLEDKNGVNFDINDYPILCIYNLGSFLNPKEIPPEAAQAIFSSLNRYTGIKKVIIESRSEYVTPETLKNIRDVYQGTIEVGIGLESNNYQIRELCHHKNMPDLNQFRYAVKCLHDFNFKALAYVNQKPPFLTEKEAINDAIQTSIYAFEQGVDAVSIEPTSIQNNSLTDLLTRHGDYRVPWLWSVIEVVRGIYDHFGYDHKMDLRIGGYFDETVLSGSQGVASGVERNEIFPHTTSGNCLHCNTRIIDAIKEFNRTYDPQVLFSQEKCQSCYYQWQQEISKTETKTIPQRIINILDII